jgi:hypothetical protein
MRLVVVPFIIAARGPAAIRNDEYGRVLAVASLLHGSEYGGVEFAIVFLLESWQSQESSVEFMREGMRDR